MFLSLSAHSQARLEDKINNVFEHIYDFELNTADSLIDVYESSDDHYVWPLMRANVNWWRILSGNEDDEELNDLFVAQLNEAKDRAREQNSEDDYVGTFTVIIVNAFRTRLDLLNENYLTAVGYLNSCIDDVSESFGYEPKYEPFYLSSGLYYYFMEKAHIDYPLMRPYLFFFPDGDMEKGIDYLVKCTNSKDVFLHTEASYFLMRIYYDLEENYALAKRYNDMLLSEHPDNVIYLLFDAKIQQALGDDRGLEEAKHAYRQKVNDSRFFSEREKTHFYQILNEELSTKKPQ